MRRKGHKNTDKGEDNETQVKYVRAGQVLITGEQEVKILEMNDISEQNTTGTI